MRDISILVIHLEKKKDKKKIFIFLKFLLFLDFFFNNQNKQKEF